MSRHKRFPIPHLPLPFHVSLSKLLLFDQRSLLCCERSRRPFRRSGIAGSRSSPWSRWRSDIRRRRMSHNIQSTCRISLLPGRARSSAPRPQTVIFPQGFQPLSRFPLRLPKSIDLGLKFPRLSTRGCWCRSGTRAKHRRCAVLIEHTRRDGDPLSSEVLFHRKRGSRVQRWRRTSLLRRKQIGRAHV